MIEYSVESNKEYNIWGRLCKIKLLFDCYEGEEIDDIQVEAIKDFETNFSKYTLSGLESIKKFLFQNYSEEIKEGTISNIFKYVVPKMIYVSKDPSKKKVIGLICHFRFDEENGIAVKYVDGNITEIGGEQIIL